MTEFKPNPTLTVESFSGRSHRFVVVDLPGIKKMNLDAKIDGSNGEKRRSVFADLTFAQAHEIADFIKANVPLPRKIHPDWAAIPVGAKFGYYEDEKAAKRGGRYPYTKVDEGTMEYLGDKRRAPEPTTWSLIVEPKPDPDAEARRVWDAMEVGDAFHFGDTDEKAERTKVSATQFTYPRSQPIKIDGFFQYGIVVHHKPTRREQVNALPDGTRFSCPGPYAPLGHYIKLQEDVVWARGARTQWSIKPDAEHYAERWNAAGPIKLDED